MSNHPDHGQRFLIEWTPGHWWIVECTGHDGSYTPIMELPRDWKVSPQPNDALIHVPKHAVRRMR